MKTKTLWEVTVGNLGNVYSGNGTDAKRQFAEYRDQSKTGYGRAAGETVTLWRDGELIKEYRSPQQDLTDAIEACQNGEFDGLRVADLAEVPSGFRGLVLHINDHGNATLYLKTARKLKEIASRV